jgi:hypothetical protein
MKENEYILATDLTKIRFAETLIRDCMKESFYGDEKAVVINILHDTCEHLSNELEIEE